MSDRLSAEKDATRCATCGKGLPPEPDPNVTVFCSARCYGIAAREGQESA